MGHSARGMVWAPVTNIEPLKPVIASGGFIQIKFSSVLITDQSGQLTPGKLHLFSLLRSCICQNVKKIYVSKFETTVLLYSIQWRSRNLNFV
jgi:hypothetical protein